MTTTPNALGTTRQLAAAIAGIRYEALPASAIAAAKTMSLDLIGCGLGAVNTHEMRAAAEVFADQAGKPEATVIGLPMRTSASSAAYLNGLCAHILEMDDTHRSSITHVGAAVIPAALAVAERENCSGKTFLAAVVVGYEAALRIANAVQPSHWHRGFLSMGTCGSFGAAAAAGHILGADGETTANALGLAGITAAGINSSIYGEGDMGKRLVPGHAAHSGVFAMLLALKGFTGSRNVLEQPKGFCEAFADEYDLSLVMKEFGESWEVEKTSLKPYSCCRYYHAPIDGLLDIMRAEALTGDEIERIAVGTYGIAVHNRPHRTEPGNPFDARMSMPYSLAVAAYRNGVSDDDFSEDLVGNPDVQAIARRVEIAEDKDATAIFPREWPAHVTVATRDGREFARSIAFPKGEPEAPMTRREIEEKFVGLARRAIPVEQARDISHSMEGMDEVQRFAEFARLLAGPGRDAPVLRNVAG